MIISFQALYVYIFFVFHVYFTVPRVYLSDLFRIVFFLFSYYKHIIHNNNVKEQIYKIGHSYLLHYTQFNYTIYYTTIGSVDLASPPIL